MTDHHTYKKIEIVGSSSTGIEDAIQNVLSECGKSVKNMEGFETSEIRGHIDDDKVAHYQVLATGRLQQLYQSSPPMYTPSIGYGWVASPVKGGAEPDGVEPAKHPFHPGEMLLKEFLETQGMSKAELARQIGWTKARLNELIRWNRGISAGAALDLADALGTSPKLWMNLQPTYDLDKAAAAIKVA